MSAPFVKNHAYIPFDDGVLPALSTLSLQLTQTGWRVLSRDGLRVDPGRETLFNLRPSFRMDRMDDTSELFSRIFPYLWHWSCGFQMERAERSGTRWPLWAVGNEHGLLTFRQAKAGAPNPQTLTRRTSQAHPPLIHATGAARIWSCKAAGDSVTFLNSNGKSESD